MSWKLVIRDGVLEDMTEAVRWYEKQRPLLGEELMEEVENTLAAIKSNPHIYQVQKKSIRHGYVSRFPYIIIYEIDNRDIIVYAVIRAQRHPGKRYARIKRK